MNELFLVRAGKYKLRARDSECILSAKAGKYKLGARAGKYKLGARAGGQAKAVDRVTQRPSHLCKNMESQTR